MDIKLTDVPVKAQTFVKTHFPGQVAENAFINKVVPSFPTYNVVMRNKSLIVFDNQGHWKEILGNGNSIPMSMLPYKSQNYIKTEYGNIGVLAIIREKDHFDVNLINNVGLKFNRKGKFLNIIGNTTIMPREVK